MSKAPIKTTGTATQKPARPAKRPGRPKGAATQTLPTADVQLSRCRKCDSTARTKYLRTTETAHTGQLPNGQPYTHIVRRWTTCSDCGQARVDLTHENRV
ncbi:MAG: hypothetical protein KF861_22945 [Planctomycetaceae bacterium]|nr:hypothetical protein [Planctomycetaceae bacterium]